MRERGYPTILYAIKAKKNVVVDLAKAFKTDDFFDQISGFFPLSDIHYIILNHMEPDHTGVIKTLRMLSPKAEIICTPKAVQMLSDYYGITEGITTVNDGDTLDIGSKAFISPRSLCTLAGNNGNLRSGSKGAVLL